MWCNYWWWFNSYHFRSRIVRVQCCIYRDHCCRNIPNDAFTTFSNRAPSQYPKRRLFVRSRKVSKPRDWYFKLPYRFEIWQAHRQHCCRSACQISERSDNPKCKSRGFETLRDLTERRLFGYWDGAQISFWFWCRVMGHHLHNNIISNRMSDKILCFRHKDSISHEKFTRCGNTCARVDPHGIFTHIL